MAAVGLVAKAARPYREARAQARQLSATERQIAALNQSNADLRRRIGYLHTPDGVASEARKMGFVRPGEIPIVIEGADQPPPPQGRPENPSLGARAQRFLRRLTGR